MEHLLPWLRLQLTPGLGRVGLMRLIQHFKSAENVIRNAERGWPELKIIGWQQVPRYNPTTNNLEWAIYGESEGKPVVNWNTRLLGRKGVMKVRAKYP